MVVPDFLYDVSWRGRNKTPWEVSRRSGISWGANFDRLGKRLYPVLVKREAGSPTEAMEQVLPGLHGSPFMRSWWWKIARVNVCAEMAALGGFFCTCHDVCVHVRVRASFLPPCVFFPLSLLHHPLYLPGQKRPLRKKQRKNCWCVYVFKFSSVVGVVHWCAWLDRYCDHCEIMRGCFVLEHLLAFREKLLQFFFSFCYCRWLESKD